jgi:hypothetical protein
MIILHSYEAERGSLLGDSICGIPAVTKLAALAAARNEVVYYDCPNAFVRAIMPAKLGLRSLYEAPSNEAHTIHRISVHALFEQFTHHYHPTVGMCLMQQLELAGTDPIKPLIEFTKISVPSYDLIFSPFSRANGVRMMPIAEWQGLLGRLSDLKIACIGSAEEPQPFANIDYLYGLPPHEVCSYLDAAKLVVTIDNGIGRLMSALSSQHLLLCSSAVWPQWGLYPATASIYDSPKNFNVNDRVITAIRSLL